MHITRLRSDVNTTFVARALNDINPEKTRHNTFAVITMQGESEAEGEGEAKHAFLLEANRKTDKDLALLAQAGGDKLIKLRVKEADGSEHVVTGKVESRVELTNALLSKTLDVTAALAYIAAGMAGIGAVFAGFEGASLLKTMHPLVSAGAGALMAFGAVTAFARSVKRTDGADWALNTVALAKDGEHAEAQIESIEKAPPKVVELQMPVSKAAFVIPMGVVKQTVRV